MNIADDPYGTKGQDCSGEDAGSYNPYVITDAAKDRLQNDFTYHSPKDTQTARYQFIRAKALEFAKLIYEMTPPSREQSVAITNLETAVFWANAAIARNE